MYVIGNIPLVAALFKGLNMKPPTVFKCNVSTIQQERERCGFDCCGSI